MDILSPAALKSLIAQQGKWCVSLYMPAHRAGRGQQEDPIRLKNLLAEAETKLLANGLRRPEVQKLMRPAEELLWSKDFWQHPADGLAIFLTNDFYKIYWLPLQFEELLHTGPSFHLKPLLPALGRGIQFYVLAVSLKNVRLFEANADTMSEIKLDFPTNMEEALWFDDPEKYLNVRSASVNVGDARGSTGIFHGHDPDDNAKKNILRFFQSVGEGLNDVMQDKNIPMVLAGVEYLLPIFREATSYQNILEDVIVGSPDRENVKELHEKAWNIVQPIFDESQKKAFEKFEQLHGQQSPLAVRDIKSAVKSAVVGQVETIFVPLGAEQWGRYDAGNHNVLLNDEPGPDDEELFDFAATQTLLNSGQVFAVPREQVPGGGEIAAILRYVV